MSDTYLTELARRFRKLASKDQATVVLAYVNYDRCSTSRFVDHFFSFALIAPLSAFYPDQCPKNERKRRLQEYVDEIETVVRRLRSHAGVVRDVLSGQNFTPLLLPLRNFQSDVLRFQIRRLFEILGTAEDPRVQLDASKKAILTKHPLQKLNNTAFFQDDRALRFKSPGRNRHGMARLASGEHRSGCLINSRVRLGGPFDALFHYDCEYERRDVDAAYPNCHDTNVESASRAYVNIAPNDAIR